MGFNEPNGYPEKKVSSTKKCSKCKETKPISKFSKRTKSKDGLSCICRQCVRIADSKRGINIENYVNKNTYDLGPRDY